MIFLNTPGNSVMIFLCPWKFCNDFRNTPGNSAIIFEIPLEILWWFFLHPWNFSSNFPNIPGNSALKSLNLTSVKRGLFSALNFFCFFAQTVCFVCSLLKFYLINSIISEISFPCIIRFHMLKKLDSLKLFFPWSVMLTLGQN